MTVLLPGCGSCDCTGGGGPAGPACCCLPNGVKIPDLPPDFCSSAGGTSSNTPCSSVSCPPPTVSLCCDDDGCAVESGTTSVTWYTYAFLELLSGSGCADIECSGGSPTRFQIREQPLAGTSYEYTRTRTQAVTFDGVECEFQPCSLTAERPGIGQYIRPGGGQCCISVGGNNGLCGPFTDPQIANYCPTSPAWRPVAEGNATCSGPFGCVTFSAQPYRQLYCDGVTDIGFSQCAYSEFTRLHETPNSGTECDTDIAGTINLLWRLRTVYFSPDVFPCPPSPVSMRRPAPTTIERPQRSPSGSGSIVRPTPQQTKAVAAGSAAEAGRPRVPLGDWTKRAIDVVSGGRMKQKPGCGCAGRQAAMNAIGRRLFGERRDESKTT